MFHGENLCWLPDERAKSLAPSLVSKIKENQKLNYVLENSKVGIMFGILVCRNPVSGEEVVLKAFSGQIDGKWNAGDEIEVDFGEKWCPPLLDESAFQNLIKESDKEIHLLTDEIEKFENEWPQLKNLGSESSSGKILTKEEKSAFQKILELKKIRREMSKKSMKEIFDLYRVNCVQKNAGEDCGEKTFRQIFKEKLPPTGTGECCAPKLLNRCAVLGFQPLSMCEFYLGKENSSAKRKNGEFYPPCEEKCRPLMKSLLGLEILYFDKDIIVVKKPSGLLSVPGRGPEKQDCVVNRVKFLFSEYMKIEQPSVHRLDMDTSGLLVLAFNEDAHRNLNRQFEEKKVSKRYIAKLGGKISVSEIVDEERKIKNEVTERDENGNPVAGIIELPFRLDPENRPHQIFDPVYGKVGITKWRLVKIDGDGLPVVEFDPLTGRTHQLRLCSASNFGLGSPILGDDLYGKDCEMIDLKTFAADGSRIRLHLHAFFLSFVHPVMGTECNFECERDFSL